MHCDLITSANAAAGREEAFDEWYSHIHIRDIMRMRGAVSVQRFKRFATSDPAWDAAYEYFTLYEVSDAERLTAEHREAAGTDRLVMTDAIEMADVSVYYYYTLQYRVNVDLSAPENGGVLIFEQFNVADGDEGAVIEWYNQVRLPGLLGQPGFLAARFSKYLPPNQMFRRPPARRYVAVYRASELPSAMEVWSDGAGPVAARLLDRRLSAYEPLMNRLTRDDVLDPPAEDAFLERRARERARTAGGKIS